MILDNLASTFGIRMKEARELCNLNQGDAAKLLEYSNSSYLAKIEQGIYFKSVNAELVLKAARLYDVSTDFLLGHSDDWERDPVLTQEKNISGWVIRQWEKSKVKEINILRILSNKVVAIEFSVSELIKTAKESQEALNSFRQLNAHFNDMKGGAKLLRTITTNTEKSYHANNLLKRYKADLTNHLK